MGPGTRSPGGAARPPRDRVRGRKRLLRMINVIDFLRVKKWR